MSEIDGYRVWYDESNRLYMRDVSTPFGVVNSSIFYAGELLYPDEPDRVLGSGAGRYTENYNLDSQKRVSRIDVDMTSTVSNPRKTCSLKREITYNDSDAEEGNKKYASELVKSIYVRDGKKDENEPALSVYTLEYDGDGNITKHTYSKPGIAIALGTVTSSTYEYDKLNRLTRENNERLGKTWTYSYDAGGNITERKEYAYTTAEQLDNETATATKEYVYRTSGWKDQLLSYDGESIVYDASGNPTTYRGATLGFEAGRRLKSYKKAGDANAYEFTFDYRGVRNSKKTKDADGHDKTWSFYYDEDGKLWGETKSEKVLQGNFGIKLWTDKITKIGYFHLNSGLAGFTLSRQTGIAGRCQGGLYLPQKRFGRHRRNIRRRHEFNRGVRLRRMGQLHDRGYGGGQHRDNGNQPFPLPRVLLGQGAEPLLPPNPILRPSDRQIHKCGLFGLCVS